MIFTNRAAYSGAALAFRDRLVIEWNKTQQRQTFADQKRVYCKFPQRSRFAFDMRGRGKTSMFHVANYYNADLSLEFLMGRALDNAILNVGLKDVATGRQTQKLILIRDMF